MATWHPSAIKATLIAAMMALSVAVTPVPAEAAPPKDPAARELGVRAFFALESRNWDSLQVRAAAADIQTALQRNRDEPWALIALARLYLVTGYQGFNATSTEAIQAAADLTTRAARLAPDSSMVQTYKGFVEYRQGRNESAWSYYQTAMRLDPKNPLPVYFIAIAMTEARDAKGAQSWLAKAQALDANHFYRGRDLLVQRSIANLLKDTVSVERLYRTEISEFPEDPWAHGNYASWLRRQGRHTEAVPMYEQALTIMEYPAARQGLEQSRRQLAASKPAS